MPKELIRFLSSLILLAFFPSVRTCAQLNASFSVSANGGCSPLKIVFTNTSSGYSSAATFSWDLGNGDTSSQSNPTAIYITEKSYTITLTVSDGGLSSTSSQTITVYQRPTVDFSASPLNACLSSPVNFTSEASAGSGSISTYYWDFGDGNSQQANGTPSHPYATEGTASVSLTVTNSYGCTSSAYHSNLITILPAIYPSFTTDKKVLCTVSDPVRFTNTSTGDGPLTYAWNFGDGTSSTLTSPSHSYTVKGAYQVILTATSPKGCSVSTTLTQLLNVANYTAGFRLMDSACINLVDTFSENSYPTVDSRVWTIDGTPAGTDTPLIHTFTTTGNHTVTLTDIFGGCTSTASKTFNIKPGPTMAPFTADIQGKCGAPVDVNFTDHTPGAVSWTWIFQDNPYYPFPPTTSTGPAYTYHYYDNRNYSVRLTVTDANGCVSTETAPLTVFPLHVGIFEPNPGPYSTCNQPITRTFAMDHPEYLQSYTWNFGDGTTSTALSPTHTFSAPGAYITTLSWVDINGCTGSSNEIETIIGAPLNLDFAAPQTTICQYTTVDFTSFFQTPPPIVFLGYDFGDGSHGEFWGEHEYTQPGTYTISLQVSNGGCLQTVTKPNYITVLPAPTINFTPVNTCDNTRGDVSFTVRPTQATSLTWDLGDGTTFSSAGTITQFDHTYTASGEYNAYVTAVNGTCTAQYGQQVWVLLKQKPVLTASPGPICPTDVLQVQLSDQQNALADMNDNPDYYTVWQYGDSTAFLGNAQLPNEHMGSNGIATYELSGFQGGETGLRVITTSAFFGCTDTSAIIPLSINGASAGYKILSDGQCAPAAVVLQDTSRVSGSDVITSRLWDFGDGGTSTQSGTVTHIYNTPGNYLVKLTVNDASGCASSSPPAVTSVKVNGLSAAFSASANAILQNTSVYFNNNSNPYNTATPEYTWDFGDGSPQTNVPDPTHEYLQPGVYKVVLTATDPINSCSSTATTTITVSKPNFPFRQTSSFLSSASCPPVLVQFSNTAPDYTSLSWDFGDGSTATNVNSPSHVYTTPGRYAVTLKVYGPDGLLTQSSDSVFVVQPTASLSAAAAAFCIGQSGNLQATASEAIGYTWDFGDGDVSSTTEPSETHIYTNGGTYPVRLVVADSAGCQVAAAGNLSLDVHNLPVVNITPDQPLVCLNNSIQLHATGGSNYSWSPAAGLDRTDIDAPTASPSQTTTYQVLVTDDIGCKNTGTISIKVVAPETVTLRGDTAVCPGDSVQLVSHGADQYQWTGNTDGLSATNISSPWAQPVQTSTYTVTGSDAYGCFTDTHSVTVTINPVPTVSAGDDTSAIAGSPVQLAATGSSDITQWVWSPATGLSCTECPDPITTSRENITYTVTVKNGDGCQATSHVFVKMECEASRIGVPNAFTPNGDGNNDEFMIKGISIIKHLEIFDRWGDEVFKGSNISATDPSMNWNGTFKGNPAPSGVYVYFLELQCPTGGVFTRKGTVVLVR